MAAHPWRERAETTFQCEKQPATGMKGVAVTNHPLATHAASEMLLSGGNAFDAASAAMFALTVVEPMMVGILGGGMALIRHADGSTKVVDGNCCVPLGLPADCFTSIPSVSGDTYTVKDRLNVLGAQSVAVPGALPAWCQMQEKFGLLSLRDVMEPAIRLARRGFLVTPYLETCISDVVADLQRDLTISQWLMPGGRAKRAGERLTNPAYADSLELIAQMGVDALSNGPLGEALIARLSAEGGHLSLDDLKKYSVKELEPSVGTYRGWSVLSVPPPSAAGVHILQMLKILEGYDLKSMGFGTPQTLHTLSETMKIAFADRAEVTADPDFYAVPVERLISKEYADLRRQQIDPNKAATWSSQVMTSGGPNTTHITISDEFGNVISSTQTISSLFGARLMIPETGMIPNNYIATFDPVPGRTQSIEAGKRVTTSMSPTFLEHSGFLRFALGLPGGKRIFPSVLQTAVNLIDHGMSLQQAIEAPRIFTEGRHVEIEDTVPLRVLRSLKSKGHEVQLVPHVAGGMNGIAFNEDGTTTGAACWRADGTVIAIGGGLARPDVRFWPDHTVPTNPTGV